VLKNEIHEIQNAHAKREILQFVWETVVKGALEYPAISSGK